MTFWEWLDGRRKRLQERAELAVARLQLADAHVEREKLTRRIEDLEMQARVDGENARQARMASERLHRENGLLVRLLEDAHGRLERAAADRERVIVLERHNATYSASVEWAVSHINAVTVERGALLERLMGAADAKLPTPTLEFHTAEDLPPPGPIQPAPAIMGTPIPEGKTAGDVLNALRDRREAEKKAPPESAQTLMARAAEFFDDEPEGGDQAPPSIDPFSDIP